VSGKLTRHDVRQILASLDNIRALTDLLRHKHFDVDYRTVYDAVGGEAHIRGLLVEATVSEVALEDAA
jgi:hypothetical protein